MYIVILYIHHFTLYKVFFPDANSYGMASSGGSTGGGGGLGGLKPPPPPLGCQVKIKKFNVHRKTPS